MIDEALIDDPEALRLADDRGDLRMLASAGARVRTAARLAEEAGLADLRPEGRPRAVFIAGQGQAALAADTLAALGGYAGPVLTLRPTAESDPEDGAAAGSAEWALPGWAGALDLVLALTPDGSEPGLTALAAQAYTRNCTFVSVAPPGSPLAEATVQARGLPLPFRPGAAGTAEGDAGSEGALSPAGRSGGEFWPLLVPALALADRIGVLSCPAEQLSAVAEALDEAAILCRPDAAAFLNPAKTLAVELDGTLPLLWSEGPLAAAAADRFAAALAAQAGRPALTGGLPEAFATHLGLLLPAEEADVEDFFRDRVAEPEPGAGARPQLVLLRTEMEPSRVTAHALRLAEEHAVPVQQLATTRADPLPAFAELVATADFAAAYTRLASAH
ncbi:SIS domain-containing protein [Phaeacidiphilus oryzae]|uniref:SIS domain-containing protein n=1 Tax=Phaeacidiphilus oryzae TaxID=348818 RepID=UPI0005644D50|nr:SIS domain-containing protein [Phaeacidiphilus oryzae]